MPSSLAFFDVLIIHDPTRARTSLQVWQALAAVLHMSNLNFDKVDHEQGEVAAISDRDVSSIVEYI